MPKLRPIEMQELMVLAAFKTNKEFDSSGINYHLHDPEGLIEEVSAEFSKQFNENLRYYYNEEISKIIGTQTTDRQ